MSSSFLFDVDSLSLKDTADEIYIGKIESNMRIGIGGHAAVLYPLTDTISFGPNYDFTYNQEETTWYSLLIFNHSIGPEFKFLMGGWSLNAFLNYNFGYLSTEQTTSGTSGYPAPAGNFVANLPGWKVSLRSRIPISDNFDIGPYVTYNSIFIIRFPAA